MCFTEDQLEAEILDGDEASLIVDVVGNQCADVVGDVRNIIGGNSDIKQGRIATFKAAI